MPSDETDTDIAVPALTELLDKSLDGIIQEYTKAAEIPGVSLTVHRHASNGGSGETAFRSYGTAYGSDPVTPRTRFPLCSMTKHIMALALIRLLYDHGLNENTPIRQILPRFRLTNEADGTTTVTFAHLLSHTTGIDADSGMWSEIEARKVDLYDYLAGVECPNSPGARWRYANIMYDLCVPAIEALAEETVEAYLGRIFFGPLGMTATSFRGEGGEDAAEGHVRGDGAESGGDLAPKPLVIHYGADFGLRSLENPIAWKGSAGLVSCAEDMAKWLAYLPTDPFYSLIAKPQISAGDPDRPGNSIIDKPEEYGMGLFSGSCRGAAYVEHYASIPGFTGSMIYFPSLGISLVNMCNSKEGREMGYLIIGTLISRIMGEDLEPVIKSRMKRERDLRIMREISGFNSIEGSPPSPACNIVGSYFGRGIGKLTFATGDNVKIRPRCVDLPWLCWLYGDIRPLVTYLEDGKYAGCLEYSAWSREGEEAGPAKYGYPFRLEKVTGSDSLHVSQIYEGGPFLLSPTS